MCESSLTVDRERDRSPRKCQLEPWQCIKNSPHCWQVSQPGSGYQEHSDFAFNRVLSPDTPRLPYRRRRGEEKTVIHWGQRKLLMSEIEFLTLHHERGDVVVYAGAAPGTHMDYLADLFPGVSRFVLVDPAPFTVHPSDRIQIINGLFTNELADELRERFGSTRILFISDVRSADPQLQVSVFFL